MRYRLSALAGAVALSWPLLVTAQPAEPAGSPVRTRLDLAVGFDVQRPLDDSRRAFSGWRAGAASALTHWLTLVGEVGGNYDWQRLGTIEARWSAHSFLGGVRTPGPRIGRVTPFGQVLVGAVRSRAGVHEQHVDGNPFPLDFDVALTLFALQPGGGVDVALGRTSALRLQGDYHVMWRKYSGGTSRSVRLAVGLVVGLGRR